MLRPSIARDETLQNSLDQRKHWAYFLITSGCWNLYILALIRSGGFPIKTGLSQNLKIFRISKAEITLFIFMKAVFFPEPVWKEIGNLGHGWVQLTLNWLAKKRGSKVIHVLCNKSSSHQKWRIMWHDTPGEQAEGKWGFPHSHLHQYFPQAGIITVIFFNVYFPDFAASMSARLWCFHKHLYKHLLLCVVLGKEVRANSKWESDQMAKTRKRRDKKRQEKVKTETLHKTY